MKEENLKEKARIQSTTWLAAHGYENNYIFTEDQLAKYDKSIATKQRSVDDKKMIELGFICECEDCKKWRDGLKNK